MSDKKEIYYKFIFPTYESLSVSDNSKFVLDNDGKDQKGEVRALCDACPERVITYDKLDSTLRDYIDKWVLLPKYFNLRNYWDANPCQEGGMSLIVSHTPENLGNPWTKFTANDGKIVYCSLVISSGDFFYGFTLPDEVIEKSGLLDEITASKFHTNWFISTNDIVIRRAVPRAIHFNNSDIVFLDNDPSIDYIKDPNYPGYPYVSLFSLNSPSSENPKLDHERRVFIQHYFSDHYQYGLQSSTDSVSLHTDFHEDLKQDFLGLEATRRILYYYDDISLKNPDNNNLITITSTGDIPTLIDKVEYPSGIPQGYLWWSSEKSDDNTAVIQINTYIDGNWIEETVYTRPSYAQDNCALLRDWSRQITKTLTENITKLGTNTQISYQPPDVYRTDRGGCPPLQIPYNLLRYCLNDRPPFSDCETVLVMWVATPYYDSNHNLVTPDNISDSDPDKVKKLHDLGWEQYAIPISCRCCFKDDNSCNTNRFLVLYPHGETSEAKDEYAFHFRRAAKYDSTFKEVLYLQDLIRYSNDYIISLRYKSLEANFIQRYLFENASSSFRELYVRKGYHNTNREKQFYYVKVDKSLYEINTDVDTCFVNKAGTQLVPSAALTDKYQDWDLDEEDWVIRNDWLIALFDKSGIVEKSGTLTLDNSAGLKEKLNEIVPDTDNKWGGWNDIYLSSLGISPYSQIDHDFMKLSGSKSSDTIMLPLDVLDGHIQIGSIRYGSKINNKVIVGFKDVFDYTNDDYHHFEYINGSYVLANENQVNMYTAYVMSST